MFSWIWEKSIFVIWPPLLTSNDLRGQKFEFWEAQNNLKVSHIRFELGRLKLILVFFTSILTSLTSEVKCHDVYLFRIIMGGHTPIFVKNGRPWVKLCSSKVKGLLTYIVALHCDKPSYRGAPLLKIEHWKLVTISCHEHKPIACRVQSNLWTKIRIVKYQNQNIISVYNSSNSFRKEHWRCIFVIDFNLLITNMIFTLGLLNVIYSLIRELKIKTAHRPLTQRVLKW